MKNKYVIGNWKMNTTLAEAMILTGGVARTLPRLSNRLSVILLPPSIWLVPLRQRYKNVNLGAQNMYSHIEGPYTGEISAQMLKGIAKYILIGHSERRTVFGEDDALIAAKVKTALNNNLRPILAIRETEKFADKELEAPAVDRNINNFGFIKSLQLATRGLKDDDWQKIIIAYEPVWAIGTGKNATGVYAGNVAAIIRSAIAKSTDQEIAKKVPILYGGSVTRYNAAEFAAQESLDGVLVGGASLKLKEFLGIIEAYQKLLE